MIIGRKTEQKYLERVYRSKEAEFIVVYGRRRVGKTFLIRQFFEEKKGIFFQVTGSKKGNMKKQLTHFTERMAEKFFDSIPLVTPKNWEEAFKILNTKLIQTKGKIVLFFDELPWMATPRSGLLEAIDYYWNQYWSNVPNLVLIVCGSSASWLIKKIIYNKGGLHNRVTGQIRLEPFKLCEVKAYLQSRKIQLNNEHILALYMTLGGIPYYLKYIVAGKTAQQTIQNLFFEKDAPLADEFNKLFHSLFENADHYIELIESIAQKKQGVQRSVLSKTSTLSSHGGSLSNRLKDLCETGFIEEYIPWGKKIGEYYKLTDEFCLFHLHWVRNQKNKKFPPDHWIQQSQKASYHAWAGYAFEAICMKHIPQILNALKIKNSLSVGAWKYLPKQESENGAQIDLLIDRSDNAMHICEVKHTQIPFVIDKQYAKILQNKMNVFQEKTNTKKQLFLSMITTQGLKETMYSEEMVQGVVILEDLFRENT